MNESVEYIFRRTTVKEWQKLLNQWKHDYSLEILKIIHHDSIHGNNADECTIYLKRQSSPSEMVDDASFK